MDKDSHCPQNHILKDIQKFPNEIQDKKQMQRFLGILTYAESYIPRLAEMRKPLQDKLKEGITWQWDSNDTLYASKIKKKLINFSKLYNLEPNDQMIIETDLQMNSGVVS